MASASLCGWSKAWYVRGDRFELPLTEKEDPERPSAKTLYARELWDIKLHQVVVKPVENWKTIQDLHKHAHNARKIPQNPVGSQLIKL